MILLDCVSKKYCVLLPLLCSDGIRSQALHCTLFCMVFKLLQQFIITVPHISEDHLVNCLPYFLLPSDSPDIEYFPIESELCIICPKYFNLLIVAKVSKVCLGIICLVTDACILLTVHGIISLSFICLPLQSYSTAGKTAVYSSLTLCWFKLPSFYDFCLISHCWFPQAFSFLGLFIGVAVIGDENHQNLAVGYRPDIFTI